MLLSALAEMEGHGYISKRAKCDDAELLLILLFGLGNEESCRLLLYQRIHFFIKSKGVKILKVGSQVDTTGIFFFQHNPFGGAFIRKRIPLKTGKEVPAIC